MKSDVETLTIKRKSIENIKSIQQPQSSLYPVKPRKKLNVILAFVVGLMFSVFLAFFIKYLQGMGIYPRSSTTTGQTPFVKKQTQ